MQYYQQVSFFVKDDHQFNVMINNSWDLYGDASSNSALKSGQLQQLSEAAQKQETDSFYKHSASNSNKYGQSSFP